MLGGGVTACVSSDYRSNDTQEELNPHHISVVEALESMNAMMGDVYGDATRSFGGYTIETLKSSDLRLPATRSESGEIVPLPDDLLYVVNFDNEEGFAVLAADDRLPEIFAMTEGGNLSLDTLLNGSRELTPSEQYLVSLINGEIAALAAGIVRPPLDSLPQAVELFETIIVDGDTVKVPTKFKEMQMPLLGAMRWGEGTPFNMLCRTIGGLPADAGDLTIAMAQIFAANEYPELYLLTYEDTTWESIREQDYTIHTKSVLDMQDVVNYRAVSEVVNNIGNNISRLVYGLYYDVNKTELPIERVPQIKDILEYYGYDVEYNHYPVLDIYWKFDYQAVVDAVADGLPVLTVTNFTRDFFTMDGVHLRQLKRSHSGKITIISQNLYFHCNFGMDGRGNGYYIAPSGKDYGNNFHSGEGADILYPGIDDGSTTDETYGSDHIYYIFIPTPGNPHGSTGDVIL